MFFFIMILLFLFLGAVFYRYGLRTDLNIQLTDEESDDEWSFFQTLHFGIIINLNIKEKLSANH